MWRPHRIQLHYAMRSITMIHAKHTHTIRILTSIRTSADWSNATETDMVCIINTWSRINEASLLWCMRVPLGLSSATATSDRFRCRLVCACVLMQFFFFLFANASHSILKFSSSVSVHLLSIGHIVAKTIAYYLTVWISLSSSNVYTFSSLARRSFCSLSQCSVTINGPI